MPSSPPPDLTGRVCVVTGGSGGIGLETARILAGAGATVILGCRDAGKGASASADIARTTGRPAPEVQPLDTADPASIRAFADRVGFRHARVHVLVNNAGVWHTDRRTSPEGIELTWATNVLGYHRVARALEPLLRKAAPARIVNVASTYCFAPDLDLNDVEWKTRPYGNGVPAYRQSKLANRLLTWAHARRLADSGVTANAVHPGGVNSGIYRNPRGLIGWLLRLQVRLVKLTPAQGAAGPARLAASPDLEGITGRFYDRLTERACEFRDERTEEALWELVESRR